MGLIEKIAASRSPGVATRNSIDQWLSDYLLPANQFTYGNTTYPFGLTPSLAGYRSSEIVKTLPSYASALRRCPPAFAAQMVRALVLSQARFTFRNPGYKTMRNGRAATPREMFGNKDLGILERPWRNATTGELLSRMEWHAGLAGNAYVTNRERDRLRVLRPDWVAIIYGSEQEPEDAAHALDGEVVGYAYINGGLNAANRNRVWTLLPEEVAHWSPLPDPECAGVGMSWITPAIRDIRGDEAAAEHKLRFFENGAPQPLDAKILTPSGWTTMGQIQVGDLVVGSDGKPHPVEAVYPQGSQKIYRVNFSNGASTECTANHLWTVASYYDRCRGTSRTMTLAQIVDGGVSYASGPMKWSVPLVSPVEFDSLGELPLDPYLLGSLLGDGSFRGATMTFSTHRDDAQEWLSTLGRILPTGVEIMHYEKASCSEFRFRRAGKVSRNPLVAALAALGLENKLGYEKCIPEIYMRGSVNDRVSLLQGLIDTDGSVERKQPNTVRFTSTSEVLCRQVADLASGLGGVATVRQYRWTGLHNRNQWRVNVSRLPEWIVPCRLSRKAALYRTTFKGGAYRYIQSVEYVGIKQAQCIGVESHDHLYVTDDFLLTHNTPSLVVKGLSAATQDAFNDLVDMMEGRHAGTLNAYRTLYLTEGADATVVGSDMRQMDFKATQGAGETRIAFLSRVPAPILGIAEGLAGSSLNAGNFGMARRIFADSWVYPTLQDVAMALAPLVNVPSDAELWFDTSDMPLLREDAKDAAEITQIQAITISALVTEGFTPESSVAAVLAQNMALLEHTGLLSVQLQVPGATDPQGTPPVSKVVPRPIIRPPKSHKGD